MASVSTYLNFDGTCEEAFALYASVFGTEPLSVTRISDMGAQPGMPEPPEAELKLIGNIQLPILDGHLLMGTDFLESMGHKVRVGNNTTINLLLDSREEADRIFAALGEGGEESTGGMLEMPWAYWGATLDRFGIRWMINVMKA